MELDNQIDRLETMFKIRKNRMVISRLKKQIAKLEEDNVALKEKLKEIKERAGYKLMRRQPITDPVFTGCLNCSPMSTAKQDKTSAFFVGADYGLAYLYLYEKDNDDPVEYHYLEQAFSDGECTLQDIEEAFEKEIKLYSYIEVEFVSALRGEIYEYNKEDKEWYLTEQTKGWA